MTLPNDVLKWDADGGGAKSLGPPPKSKEDWKCDADGGGSYKPPRG